jgi:O-antigen/teichoic acid export membrane protein
MHAKLTCYALSGIVTVAMSFALIPTLGAMGAALANVGAEFALLALLMYSTKRCIKGIRVGRTFRISTFRASLGHLASQ